MLIIKIRALGDVIRIPLVLPIGEPPVCDRAQLIGDGHMHDLVGNEIAERPFARHLTTGWPDQAIGIESRPSQEDIPRERWIRQSADLVAEVGEEHESPPPIAEIDAEVFRPSILKRGDPARRSSASSSTSRADVRIGSSEYRVIPPRVNACLKRIPWMAEEYQIKDEETHRPEAR